MHLKAAVEAGKHVFMEKPAGVDPTGIRSVLASSKLAEEKKLAIVAGTQRRHQKRYVETMKRLHAGAVGDIVTGRCYWNQGGLWMRPRQSEWSDVEWQIRNWNYFTWLSGDHIVEQHVHNLDVMNWALQAHPVRCVGMGGRQARTHSNYGHIYDHFAVDYEYPNGVRVMSMCRQIDGTASDVSEHVVGTMGTADCSGSIRGKNTWQFQGDEQNAYVQEHTDLVTSIREGKPLNEGRQLAESTLTAIMGRMSAYTGQAVTWEEALNSPMNLMPEKLELGSKPVDPVAVPGGPG
jgi:predicted dehydrogenase